MRPESHPRRRPQDDQTLQRSKPTEPLPLGDPLGHPVRRLRNHRVGPTLQELQNLRLRETRHQAIRVSAETPKVA
jgi:hypothetical protein